jgi:hypothetical protein
MDEEKRTKFVVVLEPLASVADPIKALRWALKCLRRQHGMRCTSVREQQEDGE